MACDSTDGKWWEEHKREREAAELEDRELRPLFILVATCCILFPPLALVLLFYKNQNGEF